MNIAFNLESIFNISCAYGDEIIFLVWLYIKSNMGDTLEMYLLHEQK